MKLFANSDDPDSDSNTFQFSINQSVLVAVSFLFAWKILVMKLHLWGTKHEKNAPPSNHHHYSLRAFTHSNVEMSIFDICTHLAIGRYALIFGWYFTNWVFSVPVCEATNSTKKNDIIAKGIGMAGGNAQIVTMMIANDRSFIFTAWWCDAIKRPSRFEFEWKQWRKIGGDNRSAFDFMPNTFDLTAIAPKTRFESEEFEC